MARRWLDPARPAVRALARRAGFGPGGRSRQDQPAHPFLPPVYTALGDRISLPLQDIVLLCRHSPVLVANELARRYPESTVHLLDVHGVSADRLARLTKAVTFASAPTKNDRMEYLAGIPAPQLVIDIGTDLDAQLARCAELFYFVQDGGTYLLDHRRSEEGESESQSAASRASRASPPEQLVALKVAASGRYPKLLTGEFAASCAGVEFEGTLAFLRKRYAHRLQLRDDIADRRLSRLYGTAWGATVAERPAHRFDITSKVTVHGHRGEWYGQLEREVVVDRIDVPRLRVRRYHDVLCWPEQQIAKDNVWLPDTFRHPYDSELRHRRLVRANLWLSRRPDTRETPTRVLPGPLFYFDTEYPAHFGHVLTEVVSRWWGWEEARRLAPGLRPLLTRPAGADGIPGFQRDIFDALGIDCDQIEYLDPGDVVSVAELYAASPMLSMPHYVSPELADTWSRVGAALQKVDPRSPKRIFIARRLKPIRSCINAAEVEAFFADLGFESFYPEDHSFRDQVSAFAAADVIAGFAGSNMFTAMFVGPKKLIVISADTYSANNEFMIGAVTGGELHYVIGDALHKHPPGAWTWTAYQSNFTVDIERLGPGIRAALG